MRKSHVEVELYKLIEADGLEHEFGSASDLEEWVAWNPERCIGAKVQEIFKLIELWPGTHDEPAESSVIREELGAEYDCEEQFSELMERKEEEPYWGAA